MRSNEWILRVGIEEGVSEKLRIRSSAKPHRLANRLVRGVVLNGDENLGRVGIKRSALYI